MPMSIATRVRHSSRDEEESPEMGTEVVRLSLITHAMTDALHRASFPGDEPVNAMGLRDLARIEPQPGTVFAGPERRTTETASRLFSDATAHPGLADISYGEWAGRALTDLTDAEAASWLTDTAATPPGGESIDDLFARVAGWLTEVAAGLGDDGGPGGHVGRGNTEVRGKCVAVTHPAVVRAVIVLAMGAPALSFWRVDVAPLTRTALHCRGGRWTLRSVSEKLS